jgi:hypothetical protein
MTNAPASPDRFIYSFTLPRTFNSVEFLPPRLMMQADSVRWLISTILRKAAARDTDTWGVVRLDSRILRRIMGRESSDIIEALERGGAIETTPYYAGVRCKGYRLAERYSADRCITRPAVDRRLIDRLNQERRRQDAEDPLALWLPIHHQLHAEQQRLTIAPEADEILASLPADCRLCQDVLVENLRNRKFPFTVSTTGRVFNAITGLKRELRQALRINGKPLGGVDIACAQPALLAFAMVQEYPTNGGGGAFTYQKDPTNGLKGRTTYKHSKRPAEHVLWRVVA